MNKLHTYRFHDVTFCFVISTQLLSMYFQLSFHNSMTPEAGKASRKMRDDVRF